MDVCCECCLLSGRGLCDELITCQEESYRLWFVVVCDLETSWMRRHWPTGGGGLSRHRQTDNQFTSFRRCFRRRSLLVIYINRTQLPNSLSTSLTPAWFTPFCFNVHCQFTSLLNGRVHLNRRGTSVQSTAGSRGVCISGSNAGYTMFRGSVKGTGYPLHSPVSPSLPPPRASPCAITFQLDSASATLHSPFCSDHVAYLHLYAYLCPGYKHYDDTRDLRAKKYHVLC